MIDLHIHTIYSDGTDSVEELLKKAEDKQLEVISITDHDEVGSYFELEKDKKLRNLYSGKIIIGAELKTVWNRVPIEILAYGIDYKKLRIHKINMKELQKEVLEKLKKVARDLGLIYDEKTQTYIKYPDFYGNHINEVNNTISFILIQLATLCNDEKFKDVIDKLFENWYNLIKDDNSLKCLSNYYKD